MEYFASSATINGEKFTVRYVNDPDELPRFGNRNVELSINRPFPIELGVRDARTGEHLHGVCVAAGYATQPLSGLEFHQVATTLGLVARDARSPFTFTPTPLPWPTAVRTYCVASPGYISQEIDLDLNSGGSRPVLLRRSEQEQAASHLPLAASVLRSQENPLRAESGAGARAIEAALTVVRDHDSKLHKARAATVVPPSSEKANRGEALVKISVLALDDSTFEPIRSRHLVWSTFMEDEVSLPGREVARREADGARFEFCVPEGPVRLRFYGRYFQRFENVIAFENAEFVFEIDVSDAAAATIRLVDGKATVPWPRLDQDVVERVDAQCAQGSMASMFGPFQIAGARPGRYRIRVPHINGYEPHPPVEFDLIAAESTEVVIELFRSP